MSLFHSRRTMMKALAAGSMSGIAASLLGRMPSAHSAPAGVKRLIVMTAGNDSMFREYWAPKDANGDTVAVGTLGVTMTQLGENHAPLQPHLSKIRFVGDVVNQCIKDHNWHGDSGHPGYMWLLTGMPTTKATPTSKKFDELAGGPSVDKYVAQELGVGSLNVGIGTSGSKTAANPSYPGAAEVAVPYASPTDSYDEVFANFSVDDAEFAERAARRKTVVDLVSGDLASLTPRLPVADRRKLDQHLTQLHALEKKLAEKPALGCAAVPAAPEDIAVWNTDNLPEIGRRQIDVLVQTLACDQRRVVSLQYGDSFGMFPRGAYDWPDEGVHTPFEEHDVSHKWQEDGAVRLPRVQTEQFYARQLAYLIEQLENTEEGDGKNLLQSTLIVFGRAMGNTYHDQAEHLFVVAGGTDFVKTGGRFDSREVPHNQLLAGICHAMGTGDTSFGHSDYGGYIDLT